MPSKARRALLWALTLIPFVLGLVCGIVWWTLVLLWAAFVEGFTYGHPR